MNADRAYAGLRPCEEFEFDLVDLLDEALAADRVSVVQHHLAGCARCRTFLQEMRAVDASLQAALPRPALSADFDARLRERIEALSRGPSRELARAAAEAEYRGLIAALRRGLTWRTVLNAVAAGSVCGTLATVSLNLAPALLGSIGYANEPTALAIGSGIGVALLGGLVAARLLHRQPMPATFG